MGRVGLRSFCQHLAELVRSHRRVCRQSLHPGPEPGPQGNVTQKPQRVKSTVAPDETRHCRQGRRTCVRYYLARQKPCSMRLGAAGNRSCLHIYSLRFVGRAEFRFLLNVRDTGKADQHTLPAPGIRPAAIAGIDYMTWGESVSSLQTRIQPTCKTGRNHHLWTIQTNDCLGGTPCCFSPDASAYQRHTIFFKELESAPVKLSSARRPVFD